MKFFSFFFDETGDSQTPNSLIEYKTAEPALALTPPDEKRFPTLNALKRFLLQGIHLLQVDGRALRLPCPATRPATLSPDGATLPRVVGRLLRESAKAGATGTEQAPLRRWTEHLQYALPDLTDIAWDRRQADNAEFLVLKYRNGLQCPSWLLSDGTLRLLALTLPAFLPPQPGVYLVEEPENGVHPKGLEIILRSLSTVPAAQVFVTTHSPLVVQQAGKAALLCFALSEKGTTIIRGDEHPLLKDWDGEPDLATIFASGLLE